MPRTRTPRIQRKRAKLLQKHIARVARGEPISGRVNKGMQQALRAVKSIAEMKTVKKVVSMRERPAQEVLGPQFRGKNLISSMVFETKNGEKIRTRLLRTEDSSKLWRMYYEGMSEKSRGLFQSRPIFTGTTTPELMSKRLQAMSINKAPHGEKLRGINRGIGGAFNPNFPLNKAEVEKGAKPKLFDPSANYVMEDSRGRIIGFFQIKYLAGTPIFGAALRDEYHGQGLGALGTRFRVEVAKRLGLKTLQATTEEGKVSKILLEREGFKPIKRVLIHEGLPTERTEILMELKL